MAKAAETAKQSVEPVEEEPKTEEPVKRRMPADMRRIPLEGDYDGWVITANKDYTYGELESLLSTNYVRMIKVLRGLVTSWEGVVDREGEPIPFVESAKLPSEDLPVAPQGVLNPWHELSGATLVIMCRSIVGLVSLPNS